jgi:hypothetical protein
MRRSADLEVQVRVARRAGTPEGERDDAVEARGGVTPDHGRTARGARGWRAFEPQLREGGWDEVEARR